MPVDDYARETIGGARARPVTVIATAERRAFAESKLLGMSRYQYGYAKIGTNIPIINKSYKGKRGITSKVRPVTRRIRSAEVIVPKAKIDLIKALLFMMLFAV